MKLTDILRQINEDEDIQQSSGDAPESYDFAIIPSDIQAALDALDNIKIFTGVVTMTDYQVSSFEVNSYENLYDIHISKITKILNNTKFKYNLNKLNNIDFL